MCIDAGLSSHSLSCIFSFSLELDNVKCWETWPEFVQSCSSVHYQLCCTPRCSTAGGQHVRCSIYTLLEFVRSNEEQFTTQWPTLDRTWMMDRSTNTFHYQYIDCESSKVVHESSVYSIEILHWFTIWELLWSCGGWLCKMMKWWYCGKLCNAGNWTGDWTGT